MHIRDAADICRPLDAGTFRRRGPQDRTLELADKLIGAHALKVAEQTKRAMQSNAIADAHAKGYGAAVNDAERAVINLRAYSRGVVSRDALPGYIAEAREALARIEGALQ